MSKIRVGILGPGAIARKFADSLAFSAHCTLTAVASRDPGRARNFTADYSTSGHTVVAHDNYEQLANDPNVDYIYVATPHTSHCEHTLLCLKAGKHVLVEKPFAMDATEAARMIGEARMQGLFLMEAMWTRTIPAIQRAKALVDEGAIGDLVMIQADLGYSFPIDYEHRIYNPKLGGGALLDLGIYPLSFASHFAGIPTAIASFSTLTETGVDGSTAFSLKHPGKVVSALHCTILASTPGLAFLYGTKGSIELGPRFIDAHRIVLRKNDGTQSIEDIPFPGPGYHFEADEAAQCIMDGKEESMLMPLDESIALQRFMDRMLHDAGVRYPAK